MSAPRTLYEKIWDDHIVVRRDDGACLIWVDRHLIHEVTTPQAFDGLRQAGRTVRRPDLTLAVPDHNVPTTDRSIAIEDPESATQVAALATNTAAFGIEHIDLREAGQGIVHVVGPEQGFTLPGAVMACGDSHTSTHGAYGALAFGIGTSQVEHVFATQTLVLTPSAPMEVRVEGTLGFGVAAKDVALAVTHAVGAGGAVGHVVEYTGDTIRSLSMEGRLTVCNMAVEIGARAGLIAPDETTFAALDGLPRAPSGEQRRRALDAWRRLPSDPGAVYAKTIRVEASAVAPLVTWGTSPEDVMPITGQAPDPDSFSDPARRDAALRSLDYMGLKPGDRMEDVRIDHVFIGSCTNGRIEDLRAAAEVLNGRRIAPGIRQALIVPGSGAVRLQAEREGLDRIFLDAGFEWREPGCSMCLAMNADRIPPGERCASTSNRNYVGRQGPGSRTHLMSPAMAAAAAIAGRLADVRTLPPSTA